MMNLVVGGNLCFYPGLPGGTKRQGDISQLFTVTGLISADILNDQVNYRK
jgi:hypothetical protein